MSNHTDILLCSTREEGHMNLIRHFGNCFKPFLFYIREGDIIL